MLIPMLRRAAGVALTGAAVATAMSTPAWSQESNQQRAGPTALVREAQNTLQGFMSDPEMKWFQDNIGRAKGVLIAPEVMKAGFILGGSGGHALLLMRGSDGRFHGPGFYTLATASIGFQAGVAVSQMATLVMTDKGVNSLLATSFKMGGDASVAAGPVGAGAKSDITTDLVTFSRAKGVSGGLNLDGTGVKVNGDWNAAYYQSQTAKLTDILVTGKVTSRDSVSLVNAVNKAAGVPPKAKKKA